MANIQYLSPEGLKKLQDELHELTTVQRKELTERLAAAKALGDLSENSDYNDAKDAINLLETRIYGVQEILKNYRLIEEGGGAGDATVRIGSTVKVLINDQERTFTIVGSNEAEPLAGKISNESPIGSALLGTRVGQEVEVRTPTKLQVYEVLEIQ